VDTFDTRVNGIPCRCQVTCYERERPMRIYGSGWGDCHPPEPAVFEFVLLDQRGRPAPWLERYVTREVEQQLLCDYLDHMKEYA